MASVWLAGEIGHVRLVLCLLQALQELQSLGSRRRYRLCIRIRFGLHAKGPLLARLYVISRSIDASVPGCIVGAGVLLRDREGRSRRCEWATRRTPRALRSPEDLPHRSNTTLTSPQPPPTMRSTPFGAARTGTFWRFAGRPSLSPTPALAALRLDALSISNESVVA